jgi:hypothetical protein
MELTWWVVAIGGCIALALCIAAVMRPMDTDRRFRLLANVERLTRLPEYRRAARLRTVSALVAIALLAATFSAAVVAASRPTGLPSASQQVDAAQPEDVIVCIGGPPDDRAVGAALRYFAARVKTFSTERIGLTSADRRLVPLTRDYQYAAARFSDLAGASEPAGRDDGWGPPVSYVDYAGDVADVLAMCVTGFPGFEQPAPQRRSLIYVGPGSLREPGDTRPVLFTLDAAGDLARDAQVQINVLNTDSPNAALDRLADQTSGLSFSGASNATGHLDEIRGHPPAPTPVADEAAAIRTTETPDLPLLLALAALIGLTVWPLAVRR